MKFKSLEAPERVKQLPQFKGIYIPVTTFIDENGIPNFKSTNDNVWKCKKEGLCAICGQKLDYWIAFMVDPKEAESREVYENPHHEECLRYAFNVCPWLYWSKARYSDIEGQDLGGGWIAVNAHPNREVSLDRPPRLGIYITNRYDNIIKKGNGNKVFRIIKMGKAKRLEWIEGN